MHDASAVSGVHRGTLRPPLGVRVSGLSLAVLFLVNGGALQVVVLQPIPVAVVGGCDLTRPVGVLLPVAVLIVTPASTPDGQCWGSGNA